MMTNKEMITVKEVADMLNVSPKTIYAWVKEKVLPAIKIRRTIRFKKRDIEQFMEKQYTCQTWEVM